MHLIKIFIKSVKIYNIASLKIRSMAPACENTKQMNEIERNGDKQTQEANQEKILHWYAAKVPYNRQAIRFSTTKSLHHSYS